MTLKFEQVFARTRNFGQNSYLEVSRKRILEEDGEETHFLLVTRGFYEQDEKTKRWTKFVTLPNDRALVQGLTKDLLAALDYTPEDSPANQGGKGE